MGSGVNRIRSTTLIGLTVALSFLSSVPISVKAQFFSDYAEAGGGAYPLTPYDIPVVYKDRNYPAAYPVAPTIYEVALMKPIEAMPGKKTVPLYIVPEDSLHLNPNKRFRIKRSLRDDGLRVNIKYPEFFGLTDGYSIPAVEIPLNKPMIVRQIDVNVLAPAGFMVPYQGDDREWPYPMSTGCLVASIPRNTYVSDDHPITIKRLFAVPSLPEYPTYRPAFDGHGHNNLGNLNGLNLNHLNYPPHGPSAAPPHPHAHGHDGLTVNFYPPNGNGRPHSHGGRYPPAHSKPKAPPVFELVPVTPKSSRRNGKKRNGKKKDDSDEDPSDEDDEDDSRDEDSDEEDDRSRCKKNDRRRKCQKKDKSTTTPSTTTSATTTTTTASTTTPTTTTASTTTAAASSIQDIIAAFSSYREREREDQRRGRISASFRDDDRDQVRDRNRDDSTEGLRSGNSASFREGRDREVRPRERENRNRDDERVFLEQPEQRGRTVEGPLRDNRDQDRDRDRENRESRRSQRTTDVPSPAAIQSLRQQMIQRQINQLQSLLSSLNLSRGSAN